MEESAKTEQNCKLVNMLELTTVVKNYETKAGTVSALKGVSLSFPSNGMVFITGKSGCGKTTMLNVIGGLDGVDGGDISVLGKSFSSFTKEDYDNYRNTFIGFIFQEYNLLSEFTVEKNIKIAMELQGRETDEEEYEKLLNQVEIQDLASRKPSELSGGQRQRVAIARALVKNPRIIMADEPTGALDSNTGVQVLETLKKLSKEKLIIVVSHDLELAERYADRIIRLVDGEIAEDITFTENEIDANVKENEESLIVRDGASLNSEEKDIIASAIKQRKKVEIIENLTYREKGYTGTVEKVEQRGEVKLQKSKMKLKSSVALGVKSLAVKPLRLIFTILLSAVAFAVFGLFDTIASFTSGGVISNLLKTTSTNNIVAEGKYVVNADTGNEYAVKISGEQIDTLSRESGYKIKGIYDLDYNRNGLTNFSYTISEIVDSKVREGASYYSDKINGFIEFSDSEIDSKGYIKDYGYKVLDGYTYPKLEYEENTNLVISSSLRNIGISTYMAESIVHYLGENTLNGKAIKEIKDLVGCTLKINAVDYTVVALIDCGEIPQKYEPLKTAKPNSQETRTLSGDFTTFINAGAYKCVFAPSGFLTEYKKQKQMATLYYSGEAKWIVQGREGEKDRTADKFLYSASDYDQNNILLFDTSKYTSEGKVALKDDEVLINANNIDSALYTSALSNMSIGEKMEISDAIRAINSSVTTYEQKRQALETIFDSDHLALNGQARERTLKLTKLYDTGEQISKTVKVVGVYFGFDNELGINGSTYRFMATDKLLGELQTCLNQGNYSRILFPSKGGGLFSSDVIAKYMAKKSGFALNWYSNSVLATIKANESTIKQAADLFLYIALVLALFSVFMLFNYITTSIISKRQTIGVLRGLGSNGKDIFSMFMSESLIIAIVNGVLACLLAFVGCIFVNNYIINTMNISISFALFGLRQILIIFAMSVMTAIISSALPIIKIAKEKPVDLIRRP